ncbi:acyltransferase family protein [Larkinella bovis]|uniref:Acyltransferase family protein n=1 Tax=Larkinella bovis TaxID=683041 RepID=A0ABW0IA41_9BACT
MKKRFHILDGFRGLFALLVAIYHFAPGPGYIGHTLFISHASYFTDFFFVLSGFVIYYNYNELKFTGIKVFLVKRFLRLYPLHIFMLLVFLLVELGKMVLYDLIPFENPPFDRNDLMAFISHLFLVQSYGMPTYWGCWNAPSWSISAEFFSYFVFCFTIIFVRKLAYYSKISFYLIFSGLALWALFSIQGNLNIKTEQFGFLRCAYSFFLGCMACVLHDRIRQTPNRVVFSVLEGLFLATSVLAIMYVPASMTYLIPIVFLATISVFSFESGYVSSLLNSEVFRTLGTLSYSIYMTHYLLMFVFKIGLINILKVQNGLVYDLMLIPYIVFILALSDFTYHHVEIKGKEWLAKLFQKQSVASINQQLSHK